MHATVECLEGKVEGCITGCRNVRSFQLNKEHTLSKMAYSEECVCTIKTFYETSSFVTVQR